jgi:hypothetical protein
MKTSRTWLAVTFVFGACTVAQADIISIQSNEDASTEGIGSFNGTIEYASFTPTTGELTITLTNTSPVDNTGYITGFVFNIDAQEAAALATLTDADYPFLGVNNESAQPFGSDFDGGAALNGNFLGGGNPHRGIAVGDTGTFTFDITASNAATLTASDFIGGEGEIDFVVRFRGFENGGSDKVPGEIVPAPGAAVALLALLAGRVSRRRR